MIARVAAVVAWAALMAPAVALAQGGGDEAANRWAEVAACAALPDATSRHHCIDGVLRRSDLLGEAQVAREASEEVRAQETAVARRPAPVTARQSVPVSTRQPAEIDDVVTTISNVRSVGFNRFLVTAADGSVWEQSYAESFGSEPEKGDSFTVKRGSLGGYRCRFENSTIYRCRQVS